jgi:hypothetical protein
VGGHFTCVLDNQGKLTTVEGVRELIEESTAGNADAGGAAAGGPGGRGGGRRGGMGMLGGMMGTAMIQRVLNDSFFRPLVEFPRLPEGPLRIGQTWTNQQEATAMMVANIVVLTTNTFQGWQYRNGHKCARIEVSGTIVAAKQRTGGGGAGGGLDLMRMLGDLSFDDAVVTGTVWLDPQLHFPVEVSMAQNFNSSGTLQMGAMAGMGGPGGRRAGANNPAAAAAAAGAAGVPVGERFSRPVSMTLLMKLRSATGP